MMRGKHWPRCPVCGDIMVPGGTRTVPDAVTCGRDACREEFERRERPFTEVEIERSQRRLEHLFGFKEGDHGD